MPAIPKPHDGHLHPLLPEGAGPETEFRRQLGRTAALLAGRNGLGLQSDGRRGPVNADMRDVSDDELNAATLAARIHAGNLDWFKAMAQDSAGIASSRGGS